MPEEPWRCATCGQTFEEGPCGGKAAPISVEEKGRGEMEYKDADGNPVTLLHLVKSEPEWAAARLRVSDTNEHHAVIEAAKALVAYSRDNVDWYRKAFVPLREALLAAEGANHVCQHD